MADEIDVSLEIQGTDAGVSVEVQPLTVINVLRPRWFPESAEANDPIHRHSRVGIMTSDPQAELDVVGDIQLSGSLKKNGEPLVLSKWETCSSATANIFRMSKVGIGVSTPEAELDVAGDINLTGLIRQSGLPTGTWSQNEQVSSDTTASIFRDSFVGIGNSNPAFQLDVGGDINLTGYLYRNGTIITFGGGTVGPPSIDIDPMGIAGVAYSPNDVCVAPPDEIYPGGRLFVANLSAYTTGFVDVLNPSTFQSINEIGIFNRPSYIKHDNVRNRLWILSLDGLTVVNSSTGEILYQKTDMQWVTTYIYSWDYDRMQLVGCSMDVNNLYCSYGTKVYKFPLADPSAFMVVTITGMNGTGGIARNCPGPITSSGQYLMIGSLANTQGLGNQIPSVRLLNVSDLSIKQNLYLGTDSVDPYHMVQVGSTGKYVALASTNYGYGHLIYVRDLTSRNVLWWLIDLSTELGSGSWVWNVDGIQPVEGTDTFYIFAYKHIYTAAGRIDSDNTVLRCSVSNRTVTGIDAGSRQGYNGYTGYIRSVYWPFSPTPSIIYASQGYPISGSTYLYRLYTPVT